MNFPLDIEDKLGFTEIRSILWQHCRSASGKEVLAKLKFSTNFKVVSMWLQQTNEFKQLIDEGKTPLITEIDVRDYLLKLSEKHSVLQRNEFVDLRLMCTEISELMSFFNHKEERFPALCALIKNISDPSDLIASISKVFDEFGEWKRNASTTLQRLLEEIDSNQKEAYSIIRRIYQQASDKNWTAETEVTIKEGRLVIPIYAEHKRKLKGVMHDESGGGKILYIEPLEVLESANKQKELELQRDREMHRILTELTKQAVIHLPELKMYTQQMAIFDFIRSKAKLAVQLDATLPEVNNSPDAEINNMYHPLLLIANKPKKKPTIPMDITLSEDQRLIIISGPNAGGKSVTIKTLALNQYLLQCGLLPCASEESQFGFYKNLFVDIGDNQSIENDLSSYSSHLTAMKYFLEKCTPTTLLVIDEIGSGTDPNFGGAMAEAILVELHKKKPRGAITTHFGSVKSMANDQEGMVNASMLYDTKKLKPLYKFEMGKPGSSFALEVAQNIGLPKQIIQQARKRSNTKQQKTDELLATLEIEKKDLQAQIVKNQETETYLESLKQDYQKLKKALEQSQKEILENAKAKASQLIDGANSEIEKTIKSIKESAADKNKTRIARKKLEKKKADITGEKQSNDTHRTETKTTEVVVGSIVRIPNSTSTGEVIQLRKNKAVVVAGIMKSTYNVADLKPVNVKPTKTKKKVQVGFMKRQESFAMELDVRGMRADEALKAIERWIDDAMIIGVSNLRLIHGKGDGILKKIVRDYYHNKSFVKRISYEDVRMGGEGVSLIELA